MNFLNDPRLNLPNLYDKRVLYLNTGAKGYQSCFTVYVQTAEWTETFIQWITRTHLNSPMAIPCASAEIPKLTGEMAGRRETDCWKEYSADDRDTVIPPPILQRMYSTVEQMQKQEARAITSEPSVPAPLNMQSRSRVPTGGRQPGVHRHGRVLVHARGTNTYQYAECWKSAAEGHRRAVLCV